MESRDDAAADDLEPDERAEADEFAEFFDDRRLVRGVRGAGVPTAGRADVAVGAALFVLSVAAAWAMRATADDLFQSEIDTSPLHPWLWVLAPVAGAAASASRPGGVRPAVWAALLVGPWVGLTAVEGLVLVDPWRGAPSWTGSALWLVLLGAVTWFVGVSVSVAVLSRRDSRDEREGGGST